MKILITADWHIGRKLYDEDLQPDLEHFFDWLLGYIRKEEIDQLLVAGDIFDQANPSNEAARTYYHFLSRLSKTGCRAVITSGNHDSPSFIEVPRELLDSMDIKVIGLFPGLERVDEILLPLRDRAGQVKAALAAIPFLHDRYIRQIGEGLGQREIQQKINDGLRSILSAIGDGLKRKFPSVPRLAMAHLHAQGAHLGEAERDIQIGKLDGLPLDDIDHFDYVGLGHIHSGMTLRRNRIKYTGSPISLTFGENTYPHQITRIDIRDGELSVTYPDIPQLRTLHRISGTWDSVRTAIENMAASSGKVPDLVDVEVLVEEPDQALRGRLDELADEMQKKGLDLTQARITLTRKTGMVHREQHVSVNDLKPTSVFQSMIEDRSYDEETRTEMMAIFHEVLAKVTQNEA